MQTNKKSGAVVLSNDDSTKVIVMFSEKAGYWGFPKGHIDTGETPEETAVREVNEETGLEIELVSGEVTTVRYSHKNGEEIELYMFIAKSKNDSTLHIENDGDKLEWIDYREVGEHLTYNNLKEAYKKILPVLEGIIPKLSYPS